jgi:hypothetical protein
VPPRRLLIALAIVIALTALAAGVAPRDPANSGGGPPPSADGAPAPPRVERTLRAEETGQRVVARVGQTILLTVEASTLDTVHIAEVGSEGVEPASPARFELLADVPGSYAIELLESGRRIGTLEIRPASG